MNELTVVENKGKVGLANRVGVFFTGVALAAMASPAFADGIDVTAAASDLKTQGSAAIVAIVMALVAMAVLAVVGKWVKATFFS